ncbi:hypothetical protein Nepgr_032959 [Nepenthes gracilis]|uniref:Uncharacterized protein n=1 Tax=Nepenthes gracilis TaxID=150966 RepID=A0AAD3TL86_NEPGR|nr:hypothetical protein Nepgr_032959 [Nepenthes gracilis]
MLQQGEIEWSACSRHYSPCYSPLFGRHLPLHSEFYALLAHLLHPTEAFGLFSPEFLIESLSPSSRKSSLPSASTGYFDLVCGQYGYYGCFE